MFYTDLRKNGVSIEHFRIMGLRSKEKIINDAVVLTFKG